MTHTRFSRFYPRPDAEGILVTILVVYLLHVGQDDEEDDND